MCWYREATGCSLVLYYMLRLYTCIFERQTMQNLMIYDYHVKYFFHAYLLTQDGQIIAGRLVKPPQCAGTEIPRWTWILLSEGQTLPYYTKCTSRTKIRPSHVKIIVFRPLIWAEKEESRFGRFPYIPLAMVSSYFVSVFR